MEKTKDILNRWVRRLYAVRDDIASLVHDLGSPALHTAEYRELCREQSWLRDRLTIKEGT